MTQFPRDLWIFDRFVADMPNVSPGLPQISSKAASCMKSEVTFMLSDMLFILSLLCSSGIPTEASCLMRPVIDVGNRSYLSLICFLFFYLLVILLLGLRTTYAHLVPNGTRFRANHA